MSRSLRIAVALPGLHRVVRGAETALEQIARQLAVLGHEVTVFGSGRAKPDDPYRFQHIPCVPREWFVRWPKLPCLRTNYAWEELTFLPGFLMKFKPGRFDVTIGCSYPFMNWILRRGARAGVPRHVFITENGDWMVQSRDAEFRFFDCDGLVCTNAQYYERHAERFPSTLIPNGVDPHVFHPSESADQKGSRPFSTRQESDLPADADRGTPDTVKGTRDTVKGTRAFISESHGKCGSILHSAVDKKRSDFFLIRQEYGLPTDRRIALMVSALIASKRVIEGVRAAADVPGLFLVVAGDGECRAEVDEEARRLLAGRYLRLKLPRERMHGLYRCADVFLHMSRDEASANVYMEALATGLPIVTHDWEVTRWTLEDQAFLVDTTHRPLVTAAIVRAMESNSEGTIRARRDLVARRFSWSSIASAYDEFLRRLCEPDGIPVPTLKAESLEDVGVVVIGRNEGGRLVRCLDSVADRAACVVYVDSGSIDSSVANAEQRGAIIVKLDTSTGFTAARARNAGVERLLQAAPKIRYIQFVDGDCEVRPSWLHRAHRELEMDAELAAVCGRRRERFPHQSIYNALIDMEWETNVGPAKSVGGDAMFRVSEFIAVNGFDPTVMAGEEPELCLRLRHLGWNFRRVACEMTLHDAAMLHFAQWWKRQVRGGYGAYDVHTRFEAGGERLFAKPTRSAQIWCIGWPVAILFAAVLGFAAARSNGAIISAGIAFLALPAQIVRLSLAALNRGRSPKIAVTYGILIMAGKLAWFRGQLKYRGDRAVGKKIELIEYKQLTPRPAEVAR